MGACEIIYIYIVINFARKIVKYIKLTDEIVSLITLWNRSKFSSANNKSLSHCVNKICNTSSLFISKHRYRSLQRISSEFYNLIDRSISRNWLGDVRSRNILRVTFQLERSACSDATFILHTGISFTIPTCILRMRRQCTNMNYEKGRAYFQRSESENNVTLISVLCTGKLLILQTHFIPSKIPFRMTRKSEHSTHTVYCLLK